MGIFDSLQNLFGGVGDLAQGSIGDALGGITDIPMLQDLQDQATSLTDCVADAVNTATEQGQTAVEEITKNIGL